MEVKTILLLVWIHFLADFVLQSHNMATKKGTSLKWLGAHVGVYTFVLLLIFGPLFAVINGVLHFVTDFISSKVTGYYWKKEQVHEFFVTIGVDQAVHITTLVLTYSWLM